MNTNNNEKEQTVSLFLPFENGCYAIYNGTETQISLQLAKRSPDHLHNLVKTLVNTGRSTLLVRAAHSLNTKDIHSLNMRDKIYEMAAKAGDAEGLFFAASTLRGLKPQKVQSMIARSAAKGYQPASVRMGVESLEGTLVNNKGIKRIRIETAMHYFGLALSQHPSVGAMALDAVNVARLMKKIDKTRNFNRAAPIVRRAFDRLNQFELLRQG